MAILADNQGETIKARGVGRSIYLINDPAVSKREREGERSLSGILVSRCAMVRLIDGDSLSMSYPMRSIDSPL